MLMNLMDGLFDKVELSPQFLAELIVFVVLLDFVKWVFEFGKGVGR